MKENYLEKLCGSWNPYPRAFYEGEPPGEALKKNHLEKPFGSWNPYPSVFYEGELPAETLRELESLS